MQDVRLTGLVDLAGMCLRRYCYCALKSRHVFPVE